ncbi:MAG: ATP-binding cassette domain-containing protein [Deltaproteobacteria bacterium]|nr:ATP-binding cassette domain-containing protein [Deltaproteobacteria bacterium]
MGFVEEHCTRALWIDNGAVGAAGSPDEVVGLYKEHAERTSKKARIVHLCETQPRPGGYGVVKARNVGVKYSLMGSKNRNAGGSNKGKKVWRKRKADFWALRDVNFTVNEGDVVGIIGANGAGKTTLCRVLSGILKSDQGEVSVDGDITALLSLGAGFNYQLTGKDNVYLNGMMLGIPKRKLKNVYGDIVEFSEIEKFMDQPVKNYSSGMRARLGFSIAASLRPDVFIIDEALSVGDMSFYEKASAKIQELMECAKAVIVVTHNMTFVETVCTRALWLDEGTIRFDGSPEEAVETYRESVKIGNK